MSLAGGMFDLPGNDPEVDRIGLTRRTNGRVEIENRRHGSDGTGNKHLAGNKSPDLFIAGNTSFLLLGTQEIILSKSDYKRDPAKINSDAVGIYDFRHDDLLLNYGDLKECMEKTYKCQGKNTR